MKKQIDVIEAVYRRVFSEDVTYAKAREIVETQLREAYRKGTYSVYP